ncbi:amidohydrolase family protein [Roseomonas sp. NAR14]|uniref:Amidohydrolase family protein n=1 Tax=Roseomonas acroporae TaxID=2937791 RepID=A0A9X1YES4_9PROT|nr:amidohydrolase family protein [Roseomonas acroporae]MCK8787775.1 amidohydrolase family protein [Roseomonas acroporae]
MHVFDPRVPAVPGAPVRHGAATVAEYRRVQRALGTTRCVVVQPSLYGLDNTATLAALADFGEAARAVVVIDPATPEAALARLHGLGVRGVRINLVQAGALTWAQARALAPRLAALGWHLQFHLTPEALLAAGDALADMPCRVVLDHLARLTDAPAHREALTAVRRLLDGGRCWVKLSAPYLVSRAGPPGFGDVLGVARTLAAAAPERMLWASDWPHATEPRKPDDAALLDLLPAWCPEPGMPARVLVANPAELYGFPVADDRPAAPAMEPR